MSRVIDAFYSDPHFRHANIIEYAGRPFRDVDHQIEELVSRYNACVGHNDFVLWLGDCWLGKDSQAAEIMSWLHGRKGLVLGNHDRSAAAMIRAGFEFLVDHHMWIRLAGRKVLACHYPYWDPRGDQRYQDRRPKKVKGQWLIHGHTHSKERVNGYQIHVGIDAWDYAPVWVEQVEAIMKGQNLGDGR